MVSMIGLITVLALFVQTPALAPEEQRVVDATLADRHLDTGARVSQAFDATPIRDVVVAIGRATRS